MSNTDHRWRSCRIRYFEFWVCSSIQPNNLFLTKAMVHLVKGYYNWVQKINYVDYDHLYSQFCQLISNNLLLLHLVNNFWLHTFIEFCWFIWLLSWTYESTRYINNCAVRLKKRWILTCFVCIIPNVKKLPCVHEPSPWIRITFLNGKWML